MTDAINISRAAAALHPGLGSAITAAGGTLTDQGGTSVATASDRAGFGAIVVGQAKRPVRLADGSLCFGAEDLRFAAAIIVQVAKGDAPAGAAPETQALVRLAERVASHDVTVLIGGPTGTGKEVLARHIHACSPRRASAFVAVNCAALPEAMLEALLFGHERGSFTGATASARGLFRAAEGGTLLLDEIAELPLGMQAKLLRVLQEREVLAVGATTPQAIDVRIIAAANRDLAAEVAAGRFRADLFYRLAVLPIATAALGSRTVDILAIAASLWLRAKSSRWPTAAALARLEQHDWPGNVRELANVLARAEVYADGDRIEAGDIVFDVPPVDRAGTASLNGQVREREFGVIRSTLAACAGRRNEAAGRLGISERTLRYKLAAMAATEPAADRMTLQ